MCSRLVAVTPAQLRITAGISLLHAARTIGIRRETLMMYELGGVKRAAVRARCDAYYRKLEAFVSALESGNDAIATNCTACA